MGDGGALLVSLLSATLRLAAPLVLAAYAGLFAERSGVVDIGLEGKMLAAAFFAAAAALASGSAWVGLLAGIVVSVAMSLLHGLACVSFRGNQVVSGLALNLLAAGITPTLAQAWFAQGGQTPAVAPTARFLPLALPFADLLRPVPVVGPLYSGVVSDQTLVVYVAAAAVPLVAALVYRTRFGLRLRAAGENPAAVDAAGIAVGRLRYLALAVGGVLCGIAGSYLSIAQGASFVRDMTAGRGYLALAALIFGKWRPVPTLVGCLLFAFTDAAQARLQGAALPGIGEIPVQAIQALPYVLTILLLAGFVGRATPPKAAGVPFVKGSKQD